MAIASRPRRRMHPRMDAAVSVDAQNAPTNTWKTAQHAVSHSAHTLQRLVAEEDRRTNYTVNTASHTKFLTLPAPTRVRGSQRQTSVSSPRPASEDSHQQASGGSHRPALEDSHRQASVSSHRHASGGSHRPASEDSHRHASGVRTDPRQ